MYMSFKTTLEGIDVIIIFDSTSVVGFIVVLHITLCMTEINYADIAHNFLIRRDFLAQSGIDHRAGGGGG